MREVEYVLVERATLKRVSAVQAVYAAAMADSIPATRIAKLIGPAPFQREDQYS